MKAAQVLVPRSGDEDEAARITSLRELGSIPPSL